MYQNLFLHFCLRHLPCFKHLSKYINQMQNANLAFLKYNREVVKWSENREIPDLWGRVDRYEAKFC